MYGKCPNFFGFQNHFLLCLNPSNPQDDLMNTTNCRSLKATVCHIIKISAWISQCWEWLSTSFFALFRSLMVSWKYVHFTSCCNSLCTYFEYDTCDDYSSWSLTMRKLCAITCHANAEFTLAGSITTGKLCKQQLHVHVPHAVRRGNINNWNFWEKQNFNLSKSYIPFACALHQNCTLVL